MERHAELLAPAGNWTCLRATVENGADAVYFGVESFNARARAENFATADLPAIMRYLRLRGVKGYLTFNVLVFADELARAAELLAAASAAGVDAVLVQDLGLARLARALAPDLPLHASTQMTVTAPQAMTLLAGRGLARFVLPREFSVADIARVHAEAPATELEAFVHGALCVAYSGQCLTSESLGGRSANRGECAQACRQPYGLVADGKPVDLGSRRYLLSPQDLAGIELLPQLLAAGVVSFKIEGRLKTPEYVANVTRHYRQALDAALAGRDVRLARGDWEELAQSFSRGLTPGYLAGVNHQTLVVGAAPKSRGLACGTVTAVKAPWVTVTGCEVALKPGDGIVFDNGDPERKEPGGPIYEVRAEGTALHLALAHEFPFASVRPGDRVWRTSDPVLNARLRASFAADHRTRPVHFKVTGRPGEPLYLTASCDGVAVEAETGEPLVPATGAGLDAEVLAEKLGALGGTPFHLQTCAVSLGAPAALPVSALKRLRRAAVEALTLAVAAPPPRHVNPAALAELRPAKTPAAAAAPELAVFCRSEEQIRAACAAGVARVYADFEDPRGFRDSVAVARAAGVPIYLATPRIEKPGEEGFYRRLAGAAPDGVLVRNLGGLLYFKEQHPQLDLIGDFSLNCANDLTARELWALGLRLVTPSYDLNAAQLEALLTHADAAGFEVVLHQHMPMFHMEHCVFAAFLSTGKDYRDCGRPCEQHDVALRDHTGNLLPVKADVGCRNTVFNGHAQSGALYLDRFRDLGVRRYRVEFLTEDAARVAALLAIYGDLVAGTRSAKEVWSSLRATQRLGVTRGTLDHA
jgi:putative protease